MYDGGIHCHWELQTRTWFFYSFPTSAASFLIIVALFTVANKFLGLFLPASIYWIFFGKKEINFVQEPIPKVPHYSKVLLTPVPHSAHDV